MALVSWQKALTLVPEKVIMDLISGGLSHGIYMNLASTFISQNIGWAHATGIIRRQLPEFSGSAFSNVFFDTLQKKQQTDYIDDMAGDDFIPDDLMIEKPLKQPTKYLYVGEFTFQDDVTGQVTKEFKSYYSNDNLTPDETEDFFDEVFDYEKYEDGRHLKDRSMINVMHNKNWDR
jgi:hypothetical protein|tara:strand:- start:671 stop:1198 length:528 start_codon:yes stop_codon:yes gene_type:complete